MAKNKQPPAGSPGVINEAFELVSVRALRPHPENPRQGDIGAIYESIQANGFYGAVVAQRSTGFILAGNHRFQAAIEAGIGEVPVVWVDVDDDRALRILLADNRTNDLASYDEGALADLLKRVLTTTDTLVGTGYEPEDLDDLLKRVEGSLPEPGDAPVEDVPAIYNVVVECEDEHQQGELLAKLSKEGYRCKALIS
jgi:ParB-like chromosome segregation protein Spo0J